MKIFVIFLGMVIGYACLDPQRVENGENDLKSDRNAWKAASLAANEPINEDEYIRSKDVPSPVSQSSDTSSNETEASEKPSPMTVTSEVEKSGQKINSGKRVMGRWSLLKGDSHPRISSSRRSMEVKRNFPRTSDTVRDTDSELAVKKRRLFRTKREESGEKGLGSAFRRTIHMLEALSDDTIRAQWHLAAAKERMVLQSLEKSGTVSTDILNEYKAAKAEERKMIQEEAHGQLPDGTPTDDWITMDDIVKGYGLGIKDPLDNYKCDDNGIGKDFAAFFKTPSPALDKYMAMKRNENDTMESFVRGTSTGSDIYDEPTANEFEGGAIDSSAEAGFECPKTKRDSGSVATEMHAQMFVIFLCMVIGIFVVDLQRLEIGEDDMKAIENAMKVKEIFPRPDGIESAEIWLYQPSLE